MWKVQPHQDPTSKVFCMLVNLQTALPQTLISWHFLISWQKTFIAYFEKFQGRVKPKTKKIGIFCFFSPWYSWKIAQLTLNYNRSLTVWGINTFFIPRFTDTISLVWPSFISVKSSSLYAIWLMSFWIKTTPIYSVYWFSPTSSCIYKKEMRVAKKVGGQ